MCDNHINPAARIICATDKIRILLRIGVTEKIGHRCKSDGSPTRGGTVVRGSSPRYRTQQIERFLHHPLRTHPRHAAMIDRTLAQ